MTYNTQREKLIMPEYGRVIQDMVDLCLSLTDRAERQRCAEAIIDIMATMASDQSQQPNFRHKLWDQLAIMSDYKLDIDFPYPVIPKDEITAKPKPLKYPMQRIHFRHYGHLTEAFMQKAKDMQAGAEREALTAMMANYMKRCLYNWNRDAMDERKVYADLENYMDGEAQLPENFHFASVSSGHLPDYTGNNSGKKKKKK